MPLCPTAPRFWVWRMVALAALALIGAALYLADRVAYADWLFGKGDAASIRQAIRLAPGTAAYYSSLAQAEPGRAVEILEKAAALNPLDSSLRLDLGAAAERRGDFPKAEASLLTAARLDPGFAPSLALSGFYFRRRDAEKFWPVVKAALAKSHGDVWEQFRQCWTLSSDAPTILKQAIPDRPEVLRQYLDFLVSEGRLDAAQPVSGRLLAHNDRGSLKFLLNDCDHLLADGRAADALAVWNGLAQRKTIPYPELTAGAGESPVNGDFRLPGLDAAFDWHFASPAGIYVDRTLRPPGLIVSFSGKQPDDAAILSQYVPLLPHRRYVLAVRYSVSGIAAESGLMCTIESAGGQDLLHGEGLLPGGAGGEVTQEIPFETPDQTTLGRLILGYRRMPGTMRIEGSLTLRRVALSLAPEEDR